MSGTFQLVPSVPTLNPDLAPGPADHGLRDAENGPMGAIASKIASQRPRTGRPWQKCSNLTPKMFQDVPTLKPRRRYRTSESGFFTDFCIFGNIATILAEKSAISWCSKFQLLLRGEICGVFVFVAVLNRYGKLEHGTFLEHRRPGGGRGGLAVRNDARTAPAVPAAHAAEASGAAMPHPSERAGLPA